MQDKKIGYLLRSVEIVNITIGQRPQGFKGDEFEFDISAVARVNPDKKVLFMVTTIDTRELDKKETLGHIVTALGFDIEHFEEVIVKSEETNNYIVPEELEILLRIIAISTTRGIMFSEFKGTHLHKAILPIVPQLTTPQEELINEASD